MAHVEYCGVTGQNRLHMTKWMLENSSLMGSGVPCMCWRVFLSRIVCRTLCQQVTTLGPGLCLRAYGLCLRALRIMTLTKCEIYSTMREVPGVASGGTWTAAARTATCAVLSVYRHLCAITPHTDATCNLPQTMHIRRRAKFTTCDGSVLPVPRQCSTMSARKP